MLPGHRSKQLSKENYMRALDVSTNEGVVRGLVEGELAIFRGIPYAAPPTGSLRFRRPQPAPHRMHTLDATKPAANSLQLPSRVFAAMGRCEVNASEDCLTVQIWAPLPFDRKRPVLIWLHGGAFVTGGGALPWYDGARLARDNDCVVVNVNYRLGALGYLFHPRLNEGNMGLLDQIQALQWVQANVAAFGGDESRVTLMGQSAGANSIACFLARPQTRPLAQRVIMLSPGFGARPVSQEAAASVAEQFCAHLSIEADAPGALDRLQRLPVDRILDAQLAVFTNVLPTLGDPTPPFIPVGIDGLPHGRDWEMAARDGAAGIDAMIGATADEIMTFYAADPRFVELTEEGLPRMARALFGTDWEERVARARLARPGGTPFELIADAQNTHFFVESIERFALAVADSGGRAWLYRFDWKQPASRFRACHCVDLPFVFGTFKAFDGAEMLGRVDARQEALSATVRKVIGNFVAHGDPNGSDAPRWLPFTANDPALLQLDEIIRTGRAESL